MTKSELLKLGYWPDWFLEGLLSDVPPIHFNRGDIATWVCPKHGNYTQKVESHLNGHGCPHCAKGNAHKARRQKNPLPLWFLDDLTPEYRTLVENQQVSLGEKLQFKCKTCGTLYFQCGNHHREGNNGCPNCKHIGRLKNSQLSKRMNNPYPQWFIDELHPDDRGKVLSREYGVNDCVRFVCPKHGVYRQIIYSHIKMSTGERKCGCRDCAAEISLYGSSLETVLIEYLTSLNVKCYKSRTLIKSPITGFPMEIDVYCPDYNIAFEVNGLYYHSIEGLAHNKDKYSVRDLQFYHRIKTDLCREKGVQLIHLWEDYFNNLELLKELVKSKLILHGYKDTRVKIYARNTEVREVPADLAREFYNRYHIQGWGHGKAAGLYYKNELMSLMSVRKASSNTVDDGSYELNRYATRSGYFIVGGFAKLESYIHKLGIKRLVSYADLSLSCGDLYLNHGWKLISTSDPDYRYVVNKTRVHKFNYRIERFKSDPDLLWEPCLTEEELAQLNGLERIYDCGKLKFVKEWQD